MAMKGCVPLFVFLAFATFPALPSKGRQSVESFRTMSSGFDPSNQKAGSSQRLNSHVPCSFSNAKADSQLHIVYSLCGNNRKEELFRSLASLLMLISSEKAAPESPRMSYQIHIITDGTVTASEFPSKQPVEVCYVLHKPNPKAAPLFAPCSTQRLYLHEHSGFSDVPQAAYLDMDTLWLDTPTRLRAEFQRMENYQHFFGMAVETTDKNGNASWYRGGFSKDLPFYGQYGLNAGVLLLNLKAIRHSGFTQERDKILRHFYPKKALPLGDQDVLNAYAFKHPERIHVMPCIYNFRSDSACYDGFPAILHGNRNLKNNFTSTYSTLYNLFGKVNLKSEV